MNKEELKKQLKEYENGLKQEVIDIINKVQQDLGDNDNTIDLKDEIKDVAYYDNIEERARITDINCISYEYSKYYEDNTRLELYFYRHRLFWGNLFLEEKERFVEELKSMYSDLL